MGRLKFGNNPRACALGIIHQSTLEARRCNELHLMQKAGAISSLQAHPQIGIKLLVNNVHICTIRPDFVYTDGARHVFEDTKGVETPMWRLKCKLLKALHGIEITEVKKCRA